jgi:uncharacterized Tic20 family protein
MTQSAEATVAGPAPVAADSKNWATLSHLSAFVMFLGIPAVVGPLVAWLIKKDDPYVEYHAKEALNFNISFMIYGIAAAISIILIVGLLLLPLVAVTWFVLAIRGSIKASAGEYHRYPFTLRFVN